MATANKYPATRMLIIEGLGVEDRQSLDDIGKPLCQRAL